MGEPEADFDKLLDEQAKLQVRRAELERVIVSDKETSNGMNVCQCAIGKDR